MDSQIDPRLRDTEDNSITVNDGSPYAVAGQPGNPQLGLQSQTLESSYDSPATIAGPTPASTGISAPGYGAPQTPHTPTAQALSPDDDTPNIDGSAPHDPNDPKRPRACEACRGLKVKCESDPNNPDGPCKRCAKAGRNCLVTQPTRKRQKKTDSRVAELEKKIDALTASLHATRGGPPPPGQSHTPGETTGFSALQQQFNNASREWVTPPARDHPPPFAPELNKPASFAPLMVTAGQKRKYAETSDSSSNNASASLVNHENGRQETPMDMIDRGVMSMEQANDFFTRYTDHMVGHLPAVVIPPGTTAADIRKTKPILFMAIMAVASSDVPSIQRQLQKELVRMFADKIVVYGEKSLELVQALQVGVIWYQPPDNFEELKFYQFVHMGVVMAIDLGLGRKRNSAKQRLIPYTWKDHPLRKNPLPDPTTIESRRAWLTCYFLASNVAMALHRPNLVRWTSFMTECMDILESSPEAAPTDKYLCHLVWTHRLAEEVGIQFSMDDPSSWVNVAEPKVQYALRGFERDLTKYSDSIPKSEKQPSLLLSFHVLSLYMHEIALHVEKPDELRPFNGEALSDPVPGLDESLTAAHIGALSSCLTAIDGIFETFLSIDVYSIRCLPVFNFVRVAYAVIVLIKLYFSASTPNSELGKVINKDNMKVEEYLDKLLEKFRLVAADDKSSPASKFLVVLVMLRSWFQKQGQAPFGPFGSQKPQGSDSATAKANDPIPTPAQQQSRQQPDQKNDYSQVNTPLQLLSEIATGNRSDQNPAGVNSNANVQAFPPWFNNPNNTQSFMYDSTTSLPDGGINSSCMPGVMPYLNPSFSADFDYTDIGDGFEQALGLTFGGLAPNPGDPGYENIRFAMEGISGLGMFQYQ